MNNENLKLFKKGESGNPKGRPKKEVCLTDILREQGELKDVEYGGEKITRAEALAKKLYALAMSGDVNAIKYIYDRAEGRPAVTVNQNITNMDNPILDMLNNLTGREQIEDNEEN